MSLATYAVLAVLAVLTAGLWLWIKARRERAAFIATLTDDERSRLLGFETNGHWHEFRELVTIERTLDADDRTRLQTLQDDYNRGAA